MKKRNWQWIFPKILLAFLCVIVLGLVRNQNFQNELSIVERSIFVDVAVYQIGSLN